MNSIQSPRYSRIQQHVPDIKVDTLYQPLRSTIIKNSYSQSRVSGQNYLQFDSGNNNLQMSRVSRKMRSLSPQQAQKLKNNIYIPINKRLVPTRNYERINGKHFQAIDCQQKYYQPITQRELKSNSNIKFGTIDKIVYQFQEQQPDSSYNRDPYYSNKNQTNLRSMNTFSPQNRLQTRFTSPQLKPSSSINNIYTNKVQINSTPINRRTNQINNFNPSQIISQPIYNNKILEVNSDLREFPSQKAITPLMSRTSFQAGINNGNNAISYVNTNKGYDFSRSNASRGYDFSKSNVSSSSQSLYKQKKKQAFKYNLFSILDEPGNTKCKSGCCAQNEIVAKNPTIYQWAQ